MAAAGRQNESSTNFLLDLWPHPAPPFNNCPAIAFIATAMPNASGGAVLVGGRLAGIHLGSSYHLDTEFLPEQV